MGTVCSANSTVIETQDPRTREIDKTLAQESAENKLKKKVLLLGPGEAGKSTFLRQLQQLTGQEFRTDYRKTFLTALRDNTLQSIKTLIRQALEYQNKQPNEYVFSDTDERHRQEIDHFEDQGDFPRELATAIVRLFHDCDAIQRTYARREEFYLMDHAAYCFENCMRFTGTEKDLTCEDIAMARKRTQGVVSSDYQVGKQQYTIVDVGGQRSERRKWLDQFKDVDAVVFFVNAASLVRPLFEDEKVNEMQETIDLFGTTLSNPRFPRTKKLKLFLFFNKMDLLRQQLQTTPDRIWNRIQQITGCDIPASDRDETHLIDALIQRFQESAKDAKVGEMLVGMQIHRMSTRNRHEVRLAFKFLDKTLGANAIEVRPKRPNNAIYQHSTTSSSSIADDDEEMDAKQLTTNHPLASTPPSM